VTFISPTHGELPFRAVFDDLIHYVNQRPGEKHKLIIGTDSHAYHKEGVVFVTAIIVHCVGKGGRFYYRKQKTRYMESFRQRIYYETFLSLEIASRFTEKLAQNGYQDLNVEIHLDVGEKGETRDIIKEVVGMVIGSGYDARIKPESYGATKVADKYTH
jgi:predicted RNase H-related nuclease YkuK (DUF458 family)